MNRLASCVTSFSLRPDSQFLTTRTTISTTRDLPQDVSVHHPVSQVEQPADESWPYPEVAGANAVWRKCVRRVSYHIRENALFPVPRPTSQLTFSVAQLLSRLGQVCTAHSAQLRGDVRPELAQFGRLIVQPASNLGPPRQPDMTAGKIDAVKKQLQMMDRSTGQHHGFYVLNENTGTQVYVNNFFNLKV